MAPTLVAAQLSSLYLPKQTIAVNVPSNGPRGTSQADPTGIPEHSSYATTLHTTRFGTLLLRALHDGLTLELISLSVDVKPVRFYLSSPVMTAPRLFRDGHSDNQNIYIVAVTTEGSLYRCVVPLSGDGALWRDNASTIGADEYRLSEKIKESFQVGVVYPLNPDCVVLGFTNGAVLRLDAQGRGPFTAWSETLIQATSRVYSWLGLQPSEGSHIVSMVGTASSSMFWTLSRGRVLRQWSSTPGPSITLAITPGREPTPSPLSTSPGYSPTVLLDARPQTLLQVWEEEEMTYILTFIPTPTNAASGGIFYLLVSVGDILSEVWHVSAPSSSAFCLLQDFKIIQGHICALWDHQGTSRVDHTPFSIDPLSMQALDWSSITYPYQTSLDPGLLENFSLDTGSMVDRFLELVMRPGVFSPLTLRQALEKYTSDLLNTPGEHPPQLSAVYPSLGEHIAAVVGCMTLLQDDASTGAPMKQEYSSALKRDWEGFIARCRDIDRRSRCPLALGWHEVNEGSIIVVERERVAAAVERDEAIALYDSLRLGQFVVNPRFGLFVELWQLRASLPAELVHHLEVKLGDIIRQDLAYPLENIIHTQATELRGRLESTGMDSRIVERVSDIDVSALANQAADLINGVSFTKAEEDDAISLSSQAQPMPYCEWWRAVTAEFFTVSVNARYEFSLALIAYIYLQPTAMTWDSKQLAEIFGMYRGQTALRYLTRQRAHISGQTVRDDAPDISLVEGITTSRNPTQPLEAVSLIHRLLSEYPDSRQDRHDNAAHELLANIGWMTAISPWDVEPAEVRFCEKLRQMGYTQTVRELLSLLPPTPAILYLRARLYINIGRGDDAAYLFEKLAGRLGPELFSMKLEDREALESVLDLSQAGTLFSFYCHCAHLFKTKSILYREIAFTQLALSVATEEAHDPMMWSTLIKGYTDLGCFDDAYSIWTVTPSEQQKRDAIEHLVYRLCESDTQLMGYSFDGFEDEVEDALSFKVRNADPRTTPNYPKILYGWYTNRGDHRNAALTMYQRARKLRNLMTAENVSMLIDETVESYLLSLNSLSLTDPKTAWLIVSLQEATGAHDTRQRKRTNKLPVDKFSKGCFENEVVLLEDVQYEYGLLCAQVDMILQTGDFPVPPSSIILRLTETNSFDRALSTACTLKLDMADIFSRLTHECLRVARLRSPESVLQEGSPDWLLTEKVSSWTGTLSDKAWRYLRQALSVYDNLETDFRYSKIALETIMQIQKAPPPPWLVSALQEHSHDFLIRINLKYGNIAGAIEQTLSYIHKEEARLTRSPPKTTGATWLPYAVIDQVLVAAAEQNEIVPELSRLRQEISSRMKKVEKLSQWAA